MFCSLLKAKLDIEAKISNLQKNYLELLSTPVRSLEITDQNNSECAKNLSDRKIEATETIAREYKAALRQHHQFSAEVIEARETAEELEEHLDNFFAEIKIEIPEELKRRQQVPRISVQTTFEVRDEEREHKENSQVYQESEEEEDFSDKENSGQNSSGGYFSPNIQIQKSLIDPTVTNAALYTPAIKSSSKLPLSKRQF